MPEGPQFWVTVARGDQGLGVNDWVDRMSKTKYRKEPMYVYIYVYICLREHVFD